MATQLKARDVGPIDHGLHTGGDQPRLQAIGKLACAKTIDKNADGDAASRRPGHRIGNLAAGDVILENVAFEMNLVRRFVDCPDQRRKILGATVQQRQSVTGQEPGGHRVEESLPGRSPCRPSSCLTAAG